jgi:hypothetical protein
MVSACVSETTADPAYILGNFPRIEIVFECVLGAPVAPAATATRYCCKSNRSHL